MAVLQAWLARAGIRTRWKAAIASPRQKRARSSHGPRPIAVLLLLPVLVLGCAANPPLLINVAGNAQGCMVRIEGRSASNSDELLAVAKPLRGRHAIMQINREAPYRCVGETVFTLQSAGLLVDDVTADGISIYEK